jgi:hypothetical protein
MWRLREAERPDLRAKAFRPGKFLH